MEIGTATSYPDRVTLFEVIRVLSSAAVTAAKLKALGVVTPALVVTSKLALIPPTVTTALCKVSKFGELLSLTRRLAPRGRLPVADVKVPPLTLYSPPVILMEVATS